MNIGCFYAVTLEIFRQFLSHSFSEGSHKSTFVPFYAQLYLLHQIIHLILRWAYFNNRIQQARWAYQLLHNDTLALLQFKIGRSGTDIDDLIHQFLKLLEFQWPIIACRRQSEAVLDQIILSGLVATIHGTYLRYGDMAFINYHQKVLGKEIQQTIGPRTRLTAIEVATVVLDARAVAQFTYHLYIVCYTLI